MGTVLPSLQNYCAALNNKYWAVKKEEIVNLGIFVLFSFLQLCNIRWTYSKHFQNDIYATDISSAAQQSTKSSSFP